MRRAVLVALGFVRALFLIAAFQLSGTAHLAGDLVEFVTTGEHVADDADHENDPNHECPPGCPTCHHVHFSGASLPPNVLGAFSWLPPLDSELVALPNVADAPRGPPLSTVYRPPRA